LLLKILPTRLMQAVWAMEWGSALFLWPERSQSMDLALASALVLAWPPADLPVAQAANWVAESRALDCSMEQHLSRPPVSLRQGISQPTAAVEPSPSEWS
jgi:hypothetical protein